MLTSPHRVRGVSLIELMVGMTVALVILIMTASMYLLAQRGSSDTLRAAKLNLEMRNMMDMMTREIRRAGYSSVVSAGTANPFMEPSSDVVVIKQTVGGSPADCVLFAYDQGMGSGNFLGFKRTGSNLSMRVGGSVTPSTNQGCSVATDAWQALNDTDIEVTSLAFDLSYQCINVSANPQTFAAQPCKAGQVFFDAVPANNDLVEIRTLSVLLAARHAQDATLSMQLTSQIKVRNDRVLTKPST